MHNFAFMQIFLMTFYVYQDLSIIKLCFHMSYDSSPFVYAFAVLFPADKVGKQLVFVLGAELEEQDML